MAFPQPTYQTAAPLEALAGTVERVTYHNAENGFAVLKVQARGKRDLVTVVGHAASVMEGEWVTASGSWVSDRTHGVQFKAQTLSKRRRPALKASRSISPLGRCVASVRQWRSVSLRPSVRRPSTSSRRVPTG